MWQQTTAANACTAPVYAALTEMRPLRTCPFHSSEFSRNHLISFNKHQSRNSTKARSALHGAMRYASKTTCSNIGIHSLAARSFSYNGAARMSTEQKEINKRENKLKRVVLFTTCPVLYSIPFINIFVATPFPAFQVVCIYFIHSKCSGWAKTVCCEKVFRE